MRCCQNAWSCSTRIQCSWDFRRCSTSGHPFETRLVSFDREMNSLQDRWLVFTECLISCAQKLSQHKKSKFSIYRFSRASNFFLPDRYFPTNSIPFLESPCEVLSIHVEISAKKPARKISCRWQERAPASKNRFFRINVENTAQRSTFNGDLDADTHTSCDSPYDYASMVKVSTRCGASVKYQRARTMMQVMIRLDQLSFSRSFMHVPFVERPVALSTVLDVMRHIRNCE